MGMWKQRYVSHPLVFVVPAVTCSVAIVSHRSLSMLKVKAAACGDVAIPLNLPVTWL